MSAKPIRLPEGSRLCRVERCVNPEPPAGDWAGCFYDGSPCQRAVTEGQEDQQ